jgi:Ca2+-binding EF-hand superfamily protein
VEITFEQYVKYLTAITEDKTSPDQLQAAFKALGAQDGIVTEADLQRAGLSADAIKHLTSTMPQVNGGYDYNAYLRQCFAA